MQLLEMQLKEMKNKMLITKWEKWNEIRTDGLSLVFENEYLTKHRAVQQLEIENLKSQIEKIRDYYEKRI
jgi:hypothetical protein